VGQPLLPFGRETHSIAVQASDLSLDLSPEIVRLSSLLGVNISSRNVA
jgi:hypothetical protein